MHAWMVPVAAVVVGGMAVGGDDRAGTPLDDPRFDTIVSHARTHRLQLLVAEVDESTSPPTLDRIGFRVDREYFYPASTIKLCAAVGALKKIESMRASGLDVSAETPLVFHPLFEDGPGEDRDESNLEGGVITVAHEIRKLFIVSDNRAFNRLLGFVGRDELNTMMWEAGLGSVRVTHRLSVRHSREQNREMPRVDMRLPDGTVHTIPRRRAAIEPDNTGVPGLDVGRDEIVGGQRRERPRSFLHSNRISLEDLLDAVVMIARPDVGLGKPGFELDEGHRSLLLGAMGMLPRESVNPVYDPETNGDSWVKFLLPGLRRVEAGAIELNKVGLAYGFTSTGSAISARGEPPRVFVAGTIYTNANETLNDNVYEYDEIARPFWADLGEVIARDRLVGSGGVD